jgi:hypothetical protein
LGLIEALGEGCLAVIVAWHDDWRLTTGKDLAQTCPNRHGCPFVQRAVRKKKHLHQSKRPASEVATSANHATG